MRVQGVQGVQGKDVHNMKARSPNWVGVGSPGQGPGGPGRSGGPEVQAVQESRKLRGPGNPGVSGSGSPEVLGMARLLCSYIQDCAEGSSNTNGSNYR